MSNRRRGQGCEREVAHDLEQELGIPFVRDLEQVRTAGLGDLITDPIFHLSSNANGERKAFTVKRGWSRLKQQPKSKKSCPLL